MNGKEDKAEEENVGENVSFCFACASGLHIKHKDEIHDIQLHSSKALTL